MSNSSDAEGASVVVLGAEDLSEVSGKVPNSSGDRAWFVLNPVLASVCIALVGLVALTSAGSSPAVALRYFAVWIFLIWLPGWLMWRLFAGRSCTEIELGGGAATGVAFFLVAWLLATAVGRPSLCVLPPIAVLLASATIPRCRVAWRVGSSGATRRGGVVWWWSMASLAALAIYKVSLTILMPSTLPPGPSRIASDTWYSLGIAQQLTNGFPVADPTFAGGSIRYHWFSLAVITGTSQISGADLPESVMHLWFVPFVVMWLVVVAALTRTILRPYEANRAAARLPVWGPLAALLTVVFPAAVVLGGPSAPALGNGLNSSSASGAFGGLFISSLGLIVLPMLRGRSTGRAWGLLLLLAIAASGMKPTVLPIVAAGCAAAALFQLLLRRRGWRTAIGMSASCLLLLAIAGRVVVGSTAGAKIQPFGMLTADVGYKRLFLPQSAPLPGTGGFWLPAITEGRPGTITFLAGVLVLFLLAQSLRLLGIVALPWSLLRGDVAAIWCGGAVLSAYLVTFLLTHSGYSQQWFALNVSGVSVALTVAVVAIAWPERLYPLGIGLAVTSVALGVGLGIVGPKVLRGMASPGESSGLFERLAPYALTVTVVVVGVSALLVARSKGAATTGRRPFSVLCVTALIIGGASLPASSAWLWTAREVPITTNPAATVSADEQRAALWVHDNTGRDAVVVSNVFCRPVTYRANCDHSTVWVSALTGRVLVLDGWVYTPESGAQYDGTVAPGRLPSPFPDRLRLSLKMIRDPDQQTACQLVDRWRAGWIFAHSGATNASPRLDEYAVKRFQSGPVSIFQLKSPELLGCGAP